MVILGEKSFGLPLKGNKNLLLQPEQAFINNTAAAFFPDSIYNPRDANTCAGEAKPGRKRCFYDSIMPVSCRPQF